MIYRAGKRWDFMYSFRYDLQLFAKDGEGGEKTEEPTAKKLTDARKKGQAAKSKEITTVAVNIFYSNKNILRIYWRTFP